jgi:transcriptional regulator with XRE-family HTH domain
MSIFCYKKLNRSIRLGLIFQKAREEQNLSLFAVAENIHVAEKYLTALENNNFDILPKAKAYRLSYIREYAGFLKLNEKFLSKQFIQEDGLKNIEEKICLNRAIKNSPLYSLPSMAKNILFAGLIILFFGYISFQVRRILEPPKLTVYSPLDGYITDDISVTIQGETETECQLAINGQEVRLNDSGQFNQTINLTNGVNALIISATKKHGKTTTVTRHIVVKNNNLTFLDTEDALWKN